MSLLKRKPRIRISLSARVVEIKRRDFLVRNISEGKKEWVNTEKEMHLKKVASKCFLGPSTSSSFFFRVHF